MDAPSLPGSKNRERVIRVGYLITAINEIQKNVKDRYAEQSKDTATLAEISKIVTETGHKDPSSNVTKVAGLLNETDQYGRFKQFEDGAEGLWELVGGIVYDAVKTKQIYDAAQAWTLELASKRFLAQKLYKENEAAYSINDSARASATVASTSLPQDVKDHIHKRAVEDYTPAIGACDDQRIWNDLYSDDQTNRRWCDEDPSLESAKVYARLNLNT